MLKIKTNELLVKQYQSGDKNALNELIEANKRIVYKLANKFYVEGTNSIDKEDLVQEGYIGLMIAAERYDFNNEKKAQFTTYAVHWIYSKINRFIGTRNTNDETSLNTPVGEDESSERLDYIEGVDYGFENIEEKLYNQQLRRELDQVMYENLTLQEVEVLKFRYGWDNNKCMVLQEIGEILAIKRERVRQIESKSLRRLRDSSWGRIKAKEYYRYKFSNENCKINEKIRAIDFQQKYMSSNSFNNYLDEVIRGVE